MIKSCAYLIGLVLAFGLYADLSVAEVETESDAVQAFLEQRKYFEQLRYWYERPAAEWPEATIDEGVDFREIGPLQIKTDRPKNNTARKQIVDLGKQLFFDPRVSGSKQLACSSCHDPDLGWSDGRTTSFGHNRKKLSRNAPSILNSGYRETLFWDGRASSLEQQTKAVLANEDEMHSSEKGLVDKLSVIKEYRWKFKKIFGTSNIKLDHIALAISAYERSVVSSTTRFDRFVRGKYDILSDRELSGMHLFRTKARCINCHSGPLFTDDKFHNIGLSMYGRPFEDLGRYDISKNPEDVGAFRTPSLRDITRTGPYMHNGLFELDVLLRLYNKGMPNDRAKQGHKAPVPIKSPHIKPLELTDNELEDIELFLATLEESRNRILPPELPNGL